MKTIDQLSGIAEGVIGESEPAKPQFDVVVAQAFQVGRAADRRTQMIVFDPRTATQYAVAISREGAAALASQLLQGEKEMCEEEAANREHDRKVILPGLGKPLA